jgi:two-component system, OmpR family, phosphate regulon sensor histidine kinase PhoR
LTAGQTSYKVSNIMKQASWYIHPVFVFVLSTIALAISLFLYIYWYVTVSEGLHWLIRHYQLDPNQFYEAKTWVVILVLSLLVGVILAGILIIFIYNLKTYQLYRLQNSFIGNFTHELKTPVTSLKLYLETFARHEIPREEQLKYINFMLSDVERLSGNINSILNLARIESKVFEGDHDLRDLVEVVQQFLSANRHIFRDCDISVENPSGKPVFYPVIVSLFEILLMNILNNAVKYNESAKPRIDISFEVTKKMILIRFRDNGIGIAKGEKKKIFQKFHQGPRHDKVPVHGSGIGLYLAQHIARLHKGRIIAESEGEGKGSVFTLTLSLDGEMEDE